MLPLIITVIQTDAQQKEGLIIVGIIIVLIIVGAIYVWISKAQIEDRLYDKLADENSDLSWADYNEAINNELLDVAVKIEKKLNENDDKEKQEIASDFKNDRLHDIDLKCRDLLVALSNHTNKCNKCFNNKMRLWTLTDSLAELRCESCKKKHPYYEQDLIEVSFKNLKNLISGTIELSQLPIVRNPYYRGLQINLDWEGYRSNLSDTYPFIIYCKKEATVVNKRKKVNVSGEDARSRRISQEVKDQVWNRDGGKCVECGSNENLEFDHIIPFSKGGANTYRNLQLLCENCNRSKSDKIG
jgi:5-methylcytosine-specific restriction endonuclease McrA